MRGNDRNIDTWAGEAGRGKHWKQPEQERTLPQQPGTHWVLCTLGFAYAFWPLYCGARDEFATGLHCWENSFQHTHYKRMVTLNNKLCKYRRESMKVRALYSRNTCIYGEAEILLMCLICCPQRHSHRGEPETQQEQRREDGGRMRTDEEWKYTGNYVSISGPWKQLIEGIWAVLCS